MTTVLITGGAGYLGQALARWAPTDAHLHLTRFQSPLAYTPPHAHVHTIDLTDAAAVMALWQTVQPALVIHTAYRLGGPRLEQDVVAVTQHLAQASAAQGARLLHLSTDALFTGRPWPYTEADLPSPVHAYGRAKAAAEDIVRTTLPSGAFCIARTSLITGVEPWDERSRWVIESVRTGQPITLFTDELRTPVAVDDLARALWEVAGWEQWLPVLHLAGPEALSRYALGLLVLARAGLSPTGVTPGLNRLLPEPRPHDVRLDTSLAAQHLRCRLRPVSELLTSGGVEQE